MPARTILYLTPSSRLLGARRSLLELATHLDPARYRPVVVAQGPGDLVDALRDAGIPVHMHFMGWWRKGRYMLQRPFKIAALARLARAEGAALIHCNEFHSTPYAVRAARRAGALPVVVHMRLSITPRQIRNYDLARADRVVCVSEAAARDFDVWPERRDRVEVIYNGVNLEQFSAAAADRAQSRICLGLLESDFVVGQFGLIAPRKRPHLLVRAAEILKSEIPNLRILLVGSPGRSDRDYARDLESSVAAQGLEDRVRFVPFTPDVKGVYAACDLNALVSNDEGFGRTVIEAGAMSIPSVGTRIGGIPELIADGETGRLVDGNDDGSRIAEVLREMAENREKSLEMGRAARKRVEKEFSIRRHAERVMGLYDRVLTSG
ncbi:glycosyltransferase family 4 protein [Candidatus Sumerlaeota bacterium]|nr:glycosyltransferase family 4 protein [Candidatus Sumerlaeota bacterium]